LSHARSTHRSVPRYTQTERLMHDHVLHVSGLEAAVAARSPERADPAPVRPLPQSVSVHVQPLRGFLHAQPVVPGPDPAHHGQSNENGEDYRAHLRFSELFYRSTNTPTALIAAKPRAASDPQNIRR